MIVLALMIRIVGSDEMTTAEGVVINIALQLLSLAAGYSYGRRQFELRRRKGVGFSVITKDSDNSPAAVNNGTSQANND